MKKTLLAAALTLGVSGFAQAADINVGGVVWDPDYLDGPDQDFVAEFSFTQWFSAVNVTEGDSSSLNDSMVGVVNVGAILAGLTGDDSGTGFYLSGGGEVFRVNDAGTDFCPGCEVTLSFGGLQVLNDGTIDPTGGWVNVWVDDSPDFLIPVNNDGIDAFNVSNGDLWLSLDFDAFEFIFGGLEGGFVNAELSVDGGLAAANFLDSTLGGFVQQLGSAFFTPLFGGGFSDFSSAGNGQIRSDTVPEPGSLALIGLGLLGACLTYRRKNAKA